MQNTELQTRASDPISDADAPDPRELGAISAYREALESEWDYALKAVVAGILLAEVRDTLVNTSPNSLNFCLSHSETGQNPKYKAGLKHGWRSEETFVGWCKQNEISRPTAYRWMEAGERVARLLLGLPMAFPMVFIILTDGPPVPLSMALCAPESELPAEALKFRHGLAAFMESKTLAEAARSVAEGESPASRITRAGEGQSKGGKGSGDRKDWGKFIGEKLSDLSGHLSHWEQFKAAQIEEAEKHFKTAISRWPSAVLAEVSRLIKDEMKRR